MTDIIERIEAGKPLDTPDQPDPLATHLRASIDREDEKDAEWRGVEGFPRYQVSSDGRARTVIGAGGWPPMSLTRSIDSNGYVHIALYKGGRSKRCRLHRLICEAFHGPAPSPLHEVAHNDGNRQNNHHTNLRWVTMPENQHDRVRHGTAPIGEQNGRAKLTEEDVREIRALAASGIPHRHLAEQFGVTKPCINDVVYRKNWKHVA